MSLADWTRTEFSGVATPATHATDRAGIASPVATIATVAESFGSVKVRKRHATEAEASELRGLIRKVGIYYAYTESMHVEALEVALSDPVAALTSYRQAAKERGL